MKMYWCRSDTNNYSVFGAFGYMTKFMFIEDSKKTK